VDVVAVLTLAKSADDLAKGISSLTKQGEVARKAIELQRIIMKLQKKVTEAASINDPMVREIRDLKDELKAKSDLTRYQLLDLPGSANVYGLPEATLKETGELKHFLCPTCYAQGKKLVLQRNAKADSLFCFDCKCVYGRLPEKPLAKRRRPSWKTHVGRVLSQ
jgi:hypothetical protein